ncbi:MAG: hypothetical protein IT178_05255 [Acidobacteria bacterium]|nr:hypothetical protein [Acidobacteriota bacterium]
MADTVNRHGEDRSRQRTRAGGRKGGAAAAWLIGAAVLAAAGWVALRGGGSATAPAAAAVEAVRSPTGCTTGRTVYASSNGTAEAAGTAAQPLDLATALSSHGPARGCDTILLRGGTYRGAFTSTVQGSDGAPVLIRQAPGERVTLDGDGSNEAVLQVRGNWVWVMDIEVTNSHPSRESAQSGGWPSDLRRGTGVFAGGSHLKFINLVVHDVTRGFEIGSSSIDTEVYGSIVYYNGWTGPNGASNGHGIDTHNRAGTRRIADNILFAQYSHGIIAYSSDQDPTNNLVLEGNVLFNNGALSADRSGRDILIGGGSVAQQPVLRDNVTYGAAPVLLGFGAGCTGGIIEGNYFANASIDLAKCEATVTRNVIARPAPALATAQPANTFLTEGPTGVEVRVRPNQYEPGRANIVVLNWDKREAVDVDLTNIGLTTSTPFEIRDAQDFFGAPLVTGQRGPGTVSVPMTMKMTSVPVGYKGTLAHTTPEFSTLVVVPLAAGTPSSTR